MTAEVVVGVVLAAVGGSCSVLSGALGAKEVDGSPARRWSRRWWAVRGGSVAGNALFVGGLIFLSQVLGLGRGFAVGFAVLIAVFAVWFLVLLALRQRRRAGRATSR